MIAALAVIGGWTAILTWWHLSLERRRQRLDKEEAQLLEDSNKISQHIQTILYHLERMPR